jgi:tripartite-type tricarboxylate transporter receptor subunit TctC
VTSDTRTALAPEIPTFGEMRLPTISYCSWYGMFAPKSTAGEIVGKLNAAIVEALADPAVRSRLVDLGVEIFPPERQTPRALGGLIKTDAEKWWPVIRELRIKADRT